MLVHLVARVAPMATQSLYRRFRPRKFSELYGQEHVVRALRNAVINGREGQAYLFSGPRGTGKTTTARILAKVLNCANPVEGEPCCECESCVAVDNGISYDVLELDAASNRGINEIRDIIDAAALNSPGRHRVFILDEAHQLTGPATVALLKTLEEPPEHVVFVLATTDPQKIPETIRSRVQHLQFHLLPVGELEKYVRHVVEAAALDVTDDDIAQVLRQGGGSARDTLSALELVAAGGGDQTDDTRSDDLLRAIASRDHAAALSAVASVLQLGLDARSVAEDALRTLRDGFLAMMSPELVHATSSRAAELEAIARELGPQRTVHAMETLGTTLVEMRHAPDPRLLLEVAVVKLSAPAFDDAAENLLVRIKQLEEAVRDLRANGVAAQVPPAPINKATGRAKVGGLASSDTGGIVRDTTGPVPSAPADPTPVATERPASATDTLKTDSAGDPPAGDPAQMWPQIIDSLKNFAKALFKPTSVASVDGRVVTVRLPGNTPVKRAEEQAGALQAAVEATCGGKWRVVFVQADPTGGIERPTLDEPITQEPRTIVDEVRDDPFAPVDPSELIDASGAPDPLEEALRDKFPGGRFEEAAPPDDAAPRGKK